MRDPSAMPGQVGRGRAAWVLAVLFSIHVLNFADRAILGVVADIVAREFHVSNADIGFLAGTSFVVLNCIAGLAMGSIVDKWLRNRMLGIAVGLWSGMTALSGLSFSFAQLAVARIGVGLGEAVGNPVSHSLLADIFPPRSRGKAFAVYYCAPYLGTGLCIALAGAIVHAWPSRCGDFGLCDIANWQAPFLIIGVPGLVFALAAWSIGDPATGEAARARAASRPLAATVHELTLLVPPLPLLTLRNMGPGVVRANLVIGAVIVLLAVMLTMLTHDPAQWIAVGIAFYALATWCLALRHRDPAFYGLTVGSPVFVAFILGTSLIGACSGAIGFWAVPYAIRSLGMDHASAGGLLGSAIGIGSIVGTLIGGYAADRWRRSNLAAPLWVAVISLLASVPAVAVMLTVREPVPYALALALFMTTISGWVPPIASLVQDLVLPSMRGRAASIFSVVLALIAMSAGPYAVGKIADATGSFQLGMAAPFATTPVILLVILYAIRRLPAAYAARDAAAAQAGVVIPT